RWSRQRRERRLERLEEDPGMHEREEIEHRVERNASIQVPELIGGADIKLNARLSFWPSDQPLSLVRRAQWPTDPKSAACYPTARQGPLVPKPRRRPHHHYAVLWLPVVGW